MHDALHQQQQEPQANWTGSLRSLLGSEVDVPMHQGCITPATPVPQSYIDIMAEANPASFAACQHQCCMLIGKFCITPPLL